MYVLDVIPFSRSAPAGTLTYRSRTEEAPGTLVAVTLRRRHVPGLVVSCVPVAEAKATLKRARFSLASSKPAAEGTLPPQLRAAAERIAAYHAAPLSAAYGALFAPYAHEDAPLPFRSTFPDGTGFAQEAVEGALATRSAAYGARIAEARSAGRSVLLLVPTLAEAGYWARALEAHAPVLLHGALTPKRRFAALAHAFDGAKLVIATPAYAFLPLPLLGLAVLERPSAGAYRGAQRPYLDMRRVLLALAKARAVPVMLGDYPLPLELRAQPDAPLSAAHAAELVDARRTKEQDAAGERWSAVPAPLRTALEETHAAGGRALVLAVRKGYAPSVVCRDCGTTLADARGRVFTFTMRGGTRALRTADGVSELPPETTCPTCGSWNLLPLGIGIERVAEELRTAFPEASITELSGELRTQAAARKALEDAARPGAIVACTEGALPWLLALDVPAFDLAALASADSLLAVPFWRARERFVRLSLLLAQRAKRVLVATRLPEDTAVLAATGDTAPFFAEETGLRRALGYPPFGTLLALQAEGAHARLDALDASVRVALGDAPFTALPDRALRASTYRRTFVLQRAPGAWPDPALGERLMRLPPDVRVLVDPEAF